MATSIPHVWKTTMIRERKAKKPSVTRPRALSRERLKPRDPGFRLKKMREPDHEQRDGGKQLRGLLHGPDPTLRSAADHPCARPDQT